jgi:hypothetical protein
MKNRLFKFEQQIFYRCPAGRACDKTYIVCRNFQGGLCSPTAIDSFQLLLYLLCYGLYNLI